MKKLAFLLVAALFIGASTVQAKNEKISYKIQTGLNLSQITSPDYEEAEDEDYKDGVKPGFSLGFRFDYQFNNYIAIQTGLDYNMLGEKTKSIVSPEEGSKTETKIKTTAHAFQIPIMVGARYSINDDIKLQFNTGLYLGFGLGGKVKYKREIEKSETTSEITKSWGKVFGDPEKDDLKDDEFAPEGCKRFDAGWKFELGADIKKFYVGLAYDLGFVDIRNSKKADDMKKYYETADGNYKPMQSRNFSIKVGYSF